MEKDYIYAYYRDVAIPCVSHAYTEEMIRLCETDCERDETKFTIENFVFWCMNASNEY